MKRFKLTSTTHWKHANGTESAQGPSVEKIGTWNEVLSQAKRGMNASVDLFKSGVVGKIYRPDNKTRGYVAKTSNGHLYAQVWRIEVM